MKKKKKKIISKNILKDTGMLIQSKIIIAVKLIHFIVKMKKKMKKKKKKKNLIEICHLPIDITKEIQLI
jgi:hypothetical protein